MKHHRADITPAALFELVRAQLLAVGPKGLTADAIGPDSLLVDDIGLDSLKFVDLTVGLEQALRVSEFPMQEWVDGMVEQGKPLTVGALLRACEELLGAEGAEQAP